MTTTGEALCLGKGPRLARNWPDTRTFMADSCIYERPAHPMEDVSAQRTPVSSSNIRSVGYDSAGAILEIEFHNGSVYQYLGVPASEFHGLLSAQSKGRYFSGRIKNRYHFERVR